MHALPEPLYRAVKSALATAGRRDLVALLEEHEGHVDALSSGQAAALLGVSSPNTVKNWLESGHFPGAFKTTGGHWRFLRAEIEAVRARMDVLRDRNRRGELMPPEHDDDDPPRPLL
jgi:excisionase family DNA binding protein